MGRCDVAQRSAGGCVRVNEATESVFKRQREIPGISAYVEDGAAEVARADLGDGRRIAEAMIHRIQFEAEVVGEKPSAGDSGGVSSGARRILRAPVEATVRAGFEEWGRGDAKFYACFEALAEGWGDEQEPPEAHTLF